MTNQKKSGETPLFPGLEAPPRPPRRNRKALKIPARLDLDKYERDEEDLLLREVVGSWVRKKHSVLEQYVGYTRSVRQKWCSSGPPGTKYPPAGATYIDLFSGPGRVRIENTEEVLPGSPLVAWQNRGFGQFTALYVADAHKDVANDCRQRLLAVGAPVETFLGPADETVEQVLAKVNPHAYHFAFLDPFNLGNLSFEVIQKLARRLKHVDILAHVSVLDLTRNLRRYIEEHGSSLDRFAPGWRKAVDVSLPDEIVREAIMQHWRSLLKTIDMQVAGALPLITGDGGSRCTGWHSRQGIRWVTNFGRPCSPRPSAEQKVCSARHLLGRSRPSNLNVRFGPKADVRWLRSIRIAASLGTLTAPCPLPTINRSCMTLRGG